MRTVSLRSVVYGAAARVGLDMTLALPGHTLAAVVEYVNTRLRFSQERYDWPDFVRVEERQYRATYDAGTSYVTGAEVRYGDSYYRALGAVSGENPDASSNWELASDLLKSIALEQSGETAIGEVLGVFVGDPRIGRGAREVEWFLDAAGIVVPLGGASVFVEFTVQPVVYAVVDVETGGFPYVLSEYVKCAVAGDLYREDGQSEKATLQEAMANEFLEREFDKLELKQGLQRRFGVRG